MISSGVYVEDIGLPGNLGIRTGFPPLVKVAPLPRVLVFGSRDWPDAAMIERNMLRLYEVIGPYILVHGACPRGADRFAEENAMLYDIPTEPHPADWDNFGAAAGPIRNKEMAQSMPDFAMGYILNSSSGSENMIRNLRDHSPATLLKLGRLGFYSDYGFPGGV